jgi:hypothetical protein
MKKIIIALFGITLSTALLTGCGNNNNNSIIEQTSLSAEQYVSQLFTDLSNNNYRLLDVSSYEVREFRELPISGPVEDSLANLEYTILDSTYTNHLAQVTVEITATDLGLSFEEAMTEFLIAAEDMSIFTTDRRKNELFQYLFLEAYYENQGATVTNTVTIYLEQDLEASFDGLYLGWELQERNGHFADATLGGLFTAMSDYLNRPFNPERRVELEDLFDFSDMFDDIDFDDNFFDRD